MKVRLTTINDCEAPCAVDPVAETNKERRDQISDWLVLACCCVAEAGGQTSPQWGEEAILGLAAI
jgi:hypothetical protein